MFLNVRVSQFFRAASVMVTERKNVVGQHSDNLDADFNPMLYEIGTNENLATRRRRCRPRRHSAISEAETYSRTDFRRTDYRSAWHLKLAQPAGVLTRYSPTIGRHVFWWGLAS